MHQSHHSSQLLNLSPIRSLHSEIYSSNQVDAITPKPCKSTLQHPATQLSCCMHNDNTLNPPNNSQLNWSTYPCREEPQVQPSDSQCFFVAGSLSLACTSNFENGHGSSSSFNAPCYCIHHLLSSSSVLAAVAVHVLIVLLLRRPLQHGRRISLRKLSRTSGMSHHVRNVPLLNHPSCLR